MKKVVMAMAASILLLSSFGVNANPKPKAQAKKECCPTNSTCVCVPDGKGGCVCVPVSSAKVAKTVTAKKQSCPNRPGCICQ